MKILLVIDMQNDFCTNGALAIKNGESIIPFINELSKSKEYSYVVASKDYHLPNHISFASTHNKEVFSDFNGETLWTDHCVQGTFGVEFHKDLNVNFDAVFIKGTDISMDAYSAFKGVCEKDETTDLHHWLLVRGITDIDVVGLATDYCVKYSILDAFGLGYVVRLFDKGTLAVVDKHETYNILDFNNIEVIN